MTRNELVKYLCSKEGKKSEVGAGNMREIIKILELSEVERLRDPLKPNILLAIHNLACEKLK